MVTCARGHGRKLGWVLAAARQNGRSKQDGSWVRATSKWLCWSTTIVTSVSADQNVTNRYDVVVVARGGAGDDVCGGSQRTTTRDIDDLAARLRRKCARRPAGYVAAATPLRRIHSVRPPRSSGGLSTDL